MTNVLLIGGAGFLGSNLIKGMSKDKYHIFVIEPEGAYLGRLEGACVSLITGSLNDVKFVKTCVEKYQVQIVVHLVSTLIPGSSYDEYKTEYKNVIFPSIELMEFCAQKGVRFVYFSSGGTVYGNRNDVRPFKETDPMKPISYYGWSKQMMENSILYVHRTTGLKYLIVRPSNPYGHGQNIHAKQGLVAVALGKILAGEPITVWGDGSNVRDYIYIDDLCEAVTQLLEKEVCNTTINIGSGQGASINDIINVLKEVVSEDVRVDYQPARSVDVSHMILDTTRLQQYVNLKITPLREGIERFYRDVMGSVRL